MPGHGADPAELMDIVQVSNGHGSEEIVNSAPS
jgi:hypothetical protein